MEIPDFSRLQRPIHPMPDFVRRALVKHKLKDAYHSRPPYQQNDYISWITRAKQTATQEKRLNQMLDELVQGDRYMGMVWSPKKSRNRINLLTSRSKSHLEGKVGILMPVVGTFN